MSTLLIGADGQVGHELWTRLQTRGPVIATTRSGRLPSGEACYPFDLKDVGALQRLLDQSDIDQVINAAAYTAVDQAESDREAAFAINAEAPGRLARDCADRAIPLVHFSTDYVFPGTGNSPLREEDPVSPLSVYGASKLAGELAVREAGGSYRIFRLCWVYAPRGRNFLLSILKRARVQGALRVVADQVGCPTPAHWIADAVMATLDKTATLTGTWHLAASGQATWHEFATEIVQTAYSCGLLDRPVTVEAISTSDYPTPARRPAWSVLECDRLERDFGLVLPPWPKGVAEVLRRISGTAA